MTQKSPETILTGETCAKVLGIGILIEANVFLAEFFRQSFGFYKNIEIKDTTILATAGILLIIAGMTGLLTSNLKSQE